MPDVFLFAVVPYVVMVVFLIVTIQRYRLRKFTYSTLSSQFLENRLHFWGSVPFHYGILFVLFGHLGAFLMPRAILSWNAAPLRLFLLEVTGLVFALLAVVGLASIVVRRWNNPKARRVTSANDWVLYAILFVQVATGIWVAVSCRWGSSWYSSSVVPWLWSLVRLDPDVTFVAGLPLAAKLHAVNAFLLVGFFPFTRLVHILVIPNPYLWRRTQVVLWNRPRPASARRS
jgi:nitrate reductase gamma subunit